VRRRTLVVAGLVMASACTPGEGPESIPLPTSADTAVASTGTSTTTTTIAPTTTLTPPKYEATIRHTTDGVAHIIADDLSGVTYAQGWVSAENHGCTLLDQVIKVYGTRAAALGPGPEGTNIDSDFAWRAIDLATIATADFAAAPANVTDEFHAFTEGWNAYLADVGADGLSGWCAGAAWVRPLEPVEVYAYARSIALFASSARLTDFLANAQPPTPDPAADPAAAPPPAGFARIDLNPRLRRDFRGAVLGNPDANEVEMGSNGWAIGADRTESGTGGILLANPHFPWEGELRFEEVQLTVPGEIDVYGAQLVGVPGIAIGFTEGVAWTHTVSAGKRFTGYQLTLDPMSPTSYLVDGVSTPMTSTDAAVDILRADGTVDTETRTLWRSRYGPMLDIPGIGWTTTTAVSYRDANIDNDEFIEQYSELPKVQSIDDLIELNRTYQGVPLFNTIATGADGRVWYGDTSATPALSPEAQDAYLVKRFVDPVTQIAYDSGFVLLDGSTTANDWQVVDGARDPGLEPFAEMPMVERTDYVFNANDSFWVPSAEFELTGDYSILHGTQQTPVSMRSRQNAAVLGAANTLGLAGAEGNFSGLEARDAAFDNSAQTAFLLREAAVAACRATPVVGLPDVLAADGVTVSTPAHDVDVTAACDVLANWDGRYDLDRAGPMVWRETMSRFNSAERTNTGPLFVDQFDPTAPTVSPAVPNPDTAPLLVALATAVDIITTAGFSVDSTLGSAQFTERSGERIPLHGGTEVDGTTNIVSWSGLTSSAEPSPDRGGPVADGSPLRADGYPVNFGTSFIMTVDYSAGLVQAWSLLTYGETGDRESPLFESQTVRFSSKDWRTVAFTDEQIEADPDFTEQTITGD
jgi:acyl-homoserine-lactone acylase